MALGRLGRAIAGVALSLGLGAGAVTDDPIREGLDLRWLRDQCLAAIDCADWETCVGDSEEIAAAATRARVVAMFDAIERVLAVL